MPRRRRRMPVSSWLNKKRKTERSPSRGLLRPCYCYRITVGGRDYYGFTSRKPEVRLEEHIHTAQEGLQTKFYNALRKYECIIDSFTYEEYPDERTALLAEIAKIEEAGLDNLWNTDRGGKGATLDLTMKRRSKNR